MEDMSGLLKFLTKTLLTAAKPAPTKKQAKKPAQVAQTKPLTMRSNDPLGAMRDNADILGGLKFSATMQPRIPLRVLIRHGEVFSSPRGKPPKIAKAMHEGSWIPIMHGQSSFYGMMASSVGEIPADGGQFLPFLINIRRIVESDDSVENRIHSLSAELNRPQWADFVEKLEPMPGDLVRQFFPRAVDTIPGLPQATKDSLEAAGFDTASKIAAMSDTELLAFKGLGKSKLAAIRKWQKSKIDRNASRLDCVER